MASKAVRQLIPEDAAYLAGLIDGEGTITLTRRHANERRQLVLSISSTENALVEWSLTTTGVGKITGKRTTAAAHAPGLTYSVSNQQALNVLRQVVRYLRSYKRLRARLALEKYTALTPRNGKYSSALANERRQFEDEFLAIRARQVISPIAIARSSRRDTGNATWLTLPRRAGRDALHLSADGHSRRAGEPERIAMTSPKQKDLLISATGSWRTMPEPVESKRERSSLSGALGISSQATLDSVLHAIHKAAKSNESSVLGLGRPGETNEVLRVRPAREDGFAVVSVERIDSQPQPLDYRLLMSLFDLTQTEAQVAVSLMLNEDLRAIAEERHSSLETVRMHVKRVLRKTGMPSQKRLTALLATLGMLATSSGRAEPRK